MNSTFAISTGVRGPGKGKQTQGGSVGAKKRFPLRWKLATMFKYADDIHWDVKHLRLSAVLRKWCMLRSNSTLTTTLVDNAENKIYFIPSFSQLQMQIIPNHFFPSPNFSLSFRQRQTQNRPNKLTARGNESESAGILSLNGTIFHPLFRDVRGGESAQREMEEILSI